jgi:hypothetical protein
MVSTAGLYGAVKRETSTLAGKRNDPPTIGPDFIKTLFIRLKLKKRF